MKASKLLPGSELLQVFTRYTLYLLLLYFLLSLWLRDSKYPSPEEVWFFTAVLLAVTYFNMSLPGINVNASMSYVISLATCMLFSPDVAALINAFGTVDREEVLGKTRKIALIYNRLQHGLSAYICSLVFRIVWPSRASELSVVWVLALVSLIKFALNFATTSLYLRVIDGIPIMSFWRAVRPIIPGYFAVIPISYLLYVVQRSVGELGIVLFLLPIISARYALERTLEMQRQLISTVRSLATALEARDENTFGHSERVAKLAYEVARELGIKPPELDWIHIAGLLHDVGKIGVPDSVLMKQGCYSEDEFVEMAKHTVVGERIVAYTTLEPQIARWVRAHHERYDGNGYPDRLAGEEIPLPARIIAVCDAFDAMTSSRPYRERVPVSVALAELKRHAGTQFDPRAVEALERVVQDSQRMEEIYHGRHTVDVFLAPLTEAEQQAARHTYRMLRMQRHVPESRPEWEVAAR